MSNPYELDPHFKTFGTSLSVALKKLGERDSKEFLKHQKRQVETLVKLEKRLRRLLVNGSYGDFVYRKFVEFILDEKRNILFARPFFRVRQGAFTKRISKALRNRNHKALQNFQFNYTFIKFMLGCREWAEGSPIIKIVREIEKLRQELVVMNMPLAISRARIFYSRTPQSHLSYMDLIQIAAEGLISAIDKFVLPFSKVFRAVAIGRISGNQINCYCLGADTQILTTDLESKRLIDLRLGDKIFGVDQQGQVIETDVVNVYDHGIAPAFEVEFDNGEKLICSPEHKFLTPSGMKSVTEISLEHEEVYCGPEIERIWLDKLL